MLAAQTATKHPTKTRGDPTRQDPFYAYFLGLFSLSASAASIPERSQELKPQGGQKRWKKTPDFPVFCGLIGSGFAEAVF
jgi:hypothetical protein